MASDPTNTTNNNQTTEECMSSSVLKQTFVPVEADDYTSTKILESVCDYTRANCIPSRKCTDSWIDTIFPFTRWLKIYEIGWLPSDILCGITVSRLLIFFS